MTRRWTQQLLDEIAPQRATKQSPLHAEIPARRAGVSRRRLAWLATELKPDGYVLRTVDPTRNRATGRFCIAEFVASVES